MTPLASAALTGATKGGVVAALLAFLQPQDVIGTWIAWLPITVSVASVLSQVFPDPKTWWQRLIHVLALVPRQGPPPPVDPPKKG